MRRHINALLTKQNLLSILLAVLGLIAYVSQSWGHIHGQASVIDEGLYLYKGLLFVRGEYVPYQDFGLLTNHMPLSFLIPGWIQQFFGPGLRTGRYASLGLGILLVLGLWLLTRRFADWKWANIAIWGIALNPALIKIYSQAISQGLTAAMLVWVLVLTTGKERSLGEVIAGSLLAMALGMTRLNLLPVWFGLILFVWWQHGRRAAGSAFLAGMILFIGLHAIYWPDILKLWANWIPDSISPFLQAYRLPNNLSSAWNPHFTLDHRLDSLLSSIKLHLVPILGWLLSIVAVILRRRNFDPWRYQTTVFVSVLFLVLYLLHALASLGMNYCVYCLTNYLAFFSPLGLFLLAVAGREIVFSQDRNLQFGMVGVMAAFPFVVGLPIGEPFINALLSSAVPISLSSPLQAGTMPLGKFLEFKYALFPATVFYTALILYYGIGLLILTTTVFTIIRNRRSHLEGQLWAGIRSQVVIGLIFLLGTASLVFGNGYTNYDCGLDEIARNEDVGRELNSVIPSGSLIYWGIGRSPIPLLYLRDVKIFPPQLNGAYSFYFGGDTRQLQKLGYWNEQAAREWIDQADFLILDVRSESSSYQPLQDRSGWMTIYMTDSTDPCNPRSSIHVLRRIE